MRPRSRTRPVFDAPGRRQNRGLVCCDRGPLDLSRGSPYDLVGWAPLDPMPRTVRLEVEPAPWDPPWGDLVRDTLCTAVVLANALGVRPLAARARRLRGAGHGGDAVVVERARDRLGEHRPRVVPREVNAAVFTSPAWNVHLTRGMVKLGRPDLLMMLPCSDDPLLECLRKLIRVGTHSMARGATLRP